jgi:hypothetical protein
LGFAALVKTRDANQISRILRVFKEAVDPDIYRRRPKDDPDETFVRFSDLSITSVPLRKPRARKPGAIFARLLHLVHAQATLIHDQGILIRGGVTVGEVERSYGQLFGPGIIEAYHLESKIAKHPRIVVDQAVLLELAENGSLWVNDRDYDLDTVGTMLRADEDGYLFIDYLRTVRADMEPAPYTDFLSGHDKRIKEGLRKHARDRVREKYEWLRRYHDTHLKRLKNEDWA